MDTNLVTIPVTVLDRDGRYIADLTDKDFEIYENGIKQKNEFFASTEEPITVMLLLDASSSITYGQTAGMAKAVNEFVNMLRPDDQLIAASFAYRVYPILDATKIKDLKKNFRIHYQQFDPQTLIYDAVAFAQKKLKKVKGRKALIIFGDGNDDSGLSASFKSTIRAAEEQEAIIYAAQMRDYPNPPFTDPKKFAKSVEIATRYMEGLAAKTGGRHYIFDDIADLSETFTKITNELRQTYTLGYYASESGKDGERRKITVKVNIPNVAVRSRNEVIFKKPKK
ncbi:MAG TPA: VWA domain-containing protein [Pyrinomonadaceae bacterium]|nr:VWA domain-containing protein [Chloracidobacterium sp.]MBP9935345.1 VWA domain-containing protein [Pyrinomonadaceae bacterium]MBK9438755.1 VWA domain-containing protein [Chloracidobacterium sp.]MBL0241282.1 VWA domain-containing protein [Chloracidobacterium sp.]HQY66680.1 VWA domain-containing protein [Pyrinomonadaceae bacterium]